MRFNVKGMIVSDDDAALYRYFGLSALVPMCCPADIRRAIADTPAGEPLTLEINSGGGDLYAAFEMWSALGASGIEVHAEVQSIAASAASVLLTAATHATCTAVGQVMIHLPLTATEGNETAHRQAIGMLRAATDSMINAYARKCGGKKTRAELLDLMKDETFLTAQQALDCGLIDEIVGDAPAGAEDGAVRILNAAGGLLPAGLPDLTQLRAAYAAAHMAPPAAHSTTSDTQRDVRTRELEILTATLDI